MNCVKYVLTVFHGVHSYEVLCVLWCEPIRGLFVSYGVSFLGFFYSVDACEVLFYVFHRVNTCEVLLWTCFTV